MRLVLDKCQDEKLSLEQEILGDRIFFLLQKIRFVLSMEIMLYQEMVQCTIVLAMANQYNDLLSEEWLMEK
jgi:hypothetical protein